VFFGVEATTDPCLFAVAISKGCLSEEQLSQIDAAHSPLEQAIRAGMLTLDQIEKLRRLPPAPCISLGEALIRKGYLTAIQFSRAYAEFRREYPQPPRIRCKLPAGTNPSHRDIVYVFLQAFVEAFVHYSKHDLRVASTSTELPNYDHSHIWTFLQKVYTDGFFHVIMSVPEPIMRNIGTVMLRREVTTVDQAVVDAISELVNVFIGKACAKLNEVGVSSSTIPPAIAHGVRTYPARPNKVVTLNMETMQDCLTLVFAFTDSL
jgi:hypothetical protein